MSDKTFQLEEMWEYVRVSKARTGLPYDIFVDDNQAYIHNSHELWLCVDKEGVKIPVTIEGEPAIRHYPPQTLPELPLISRFIELNRTPIKLLTSGQIDHQLFFAFLKPVKP